MNRFKDIDNIFVLDASKWIGPNDFNRRAWFISKSPYNLSIYKKIKNDIIDYLDVINGKIKKLIILDLDNTLWGGIVGDDGIENLILGGHDYKGEAFLSFQKYLKSLKNKGVVLAISSKNTYDVAVDAIKNHPNMILKVDDFVSMKINWNSKVENIKEIIDELNIGYESVMFVDDSPLERQLISTYLPQIHVLDLPKDPCHYVDCISACNFFTPSTITDEDSKRTELYRQKTKLNKSLHKYSSINNLNDYLMLKLKINRLTINDINFNRVLQLLNKTNQMNLSTRRFTSIELKNIIDINNIYYASASDRYGDYGIIAIINFLNNEIVDFVLSCRVMGRGIENMMLWYAINNMKNKSKIKFNFIETKKNKPMFNFLASIGILNNGNEYYLTKNIKKPCIQLI